jgi:hypothetical protein
MSANYRPENDGGFFDSATHAAAGTPEGSTPSDESALRYQARQAIASGRLPGARPTGVWGGPGSGAGCGICGKPLARDGLGFELEFRAGDADVPQLHHMHIPCFAAWEFECHSFLQASGEKGTISIHDRAELNTGGAD